MFQAITPSVDIACPLLFRQFQADDVASAELQITGLGLYCAFLNGERVGDRYLSPGFNDYQAYLRYQTYDVSHLIRQENRLTVLLGNGWYKGRFGLDGGRGNTYGDRLLLAVKLTITHRDGAKTTLATDSDWLATSSCITQNGIYDGESRDDTLPTGSPVPCVPAELPCEPEPDFSPPIRSRITLTPALIVSPKGEYILDFGQNMAGIVRFVNRLPRGRTIRLRFGETLQSGCFYNENLRSAAAVYEYTSDGAEKLVEPYFTFYGFRYALVEGLDAPDPADFSALALQSDLKKTIEAQTDSAKINRLLENALWSQRSNFLDVPTDCPQRDERLGWTGDAQVFCATACYQMRCKDFYRKYLRDLREDQTRHYRGDIPMFSPSLGGAAGPGGAVWADAAVIIPWTLYRFYGDITLLNESYPMMRDYAETLIAKDQAGGERHIPRSGFTFGDWLALDGVNEQAFKGGTDDCYILSVYYWNSVRLCALAAGELGLRKDAARYAALASEIREAILDEFFTRSGRLSIDTQTGYVLALSFGLYRDKDVLLQGFRSRLKRDSYRMKTGFCGTPLLLPALLQNGMADEAFRFLYNDSFPGWLYCVNLGATTIWERWNSILPDGAISASGMNSLNHYAYGSVAEAVYGDIAGLRCGEHGWKSAVIAPKIDRRMRFIRVAYDSPCGRYVSEWRRGRDGSITLEVTIPPGTRARIIPPHHPDNRVFDEGAGGFSMTYQPAVDLLHPWSADSLLIDLMNDPAASALIQAKIPALYHALSSEESALLYDSLASVAQMLPMIDERLLPQLDAQLKAISID